MFATGVVFLPLLGAIARRAGQPLDLVAGAVIGPRITTGRVTAWPRSPPAAA